MCAGKEPIWVLCLWGEIGEDSGDVNRQTSYILVVDVCGAGFDIARKGWQKVLTVVAKRSL